MLTDEDLRKEYDCARSASCRNAKAKRERQETEPTPKTKAEREREERGSHGTPWHPFEDPLGPLQIGKAP
jgi:hypothetical protein